MSSNRLTHLPFGHSFVHRPKQKVHFLKTLTKWTLNVTVSGCIRGCQAGPWLWHLSHLCLSLKEQPLERASPSQPPGLSIPGLDPNHSPHPSCPMAPSIHCPGFDEWKSWVWAVMETYRRVKHCSFKQIIIIISRHWSGAVFAFQTLKSEGRSQRG